MTAQDTPTQPLLPHVGAERLSALESRLSSMSQLSFDFLILLIGSTVIATLGLFQNSPAVIIGAMIIAPLMRPLVGLSLAALTADMILLRRALLTLLVGTIIGISISYMLGILLHSISLTPEILGRTRPTLLDLGVAFFAGAIGAYCQTNQKLADGLAGVAIAVALVPPLSVVGIGLALNSVAVATGAALLYITNLVGIAFAGTLVFLVMGYTPLRQARKGLLVSTSLLILLMVPLGFSMYELVLENELSSKIQRILKERTHTFKDVHLQKVEVRRFKSPMSVLATVYGSEQKISAAQVKLVQDFLLKETGIPIDFRLRIVPYTEIRAMEVTPTGLLLTPVPLSEEAEQLLPSSEPQGGVNMKAPGPEIESRTVPTEIDPGATSAATH